MQQANLLEFSPQYSWCDIYCKAIGKTINTIFKKLLVQPGHRFVPANYAFDKLCNLFYAFEAVKKICLSQKAINNKLKVMG